jgi:hypothetical protein
MPLRCPSLRRNSYHSWHINFQFEALENAACFHLSMATSKPCLELIKFITMLLHGMGQLMQ